MTLMKNDFIVFPIIHLKKQFHYIEIAFRALKVFYFSILVLYLITLHLA